MKLSNAQKDEIIKKAAKGIAVVKLATEFNVTPVTIYHVLKTAERTKNFLTEDTMANKMEREQILFPDAQSENDLWRTKFESVSEDILHLKIMYAETSLQRRKEGLNKETSL